MTVKTNNQDFLMQLHNLLTQDLNLCKQSLDELMLEKQALATNDLLALETALQNKSKTLMLLLEVQEKMDQLLLQSGITEPGYIGINQMLQQHEKHQLNADCLLLWQQITTLIPNIQDLTYKNSTIVNNQINQTSKILDAMLGRKTTDTTYNKDGRKNSSLTDNLPWQTNTKI